MGLGLLVMPLADHSSSWDDDPMLGTIVTLKGRIF